jgi:hypothetical protein
MGETRFSDRRATATYAYKTKVVEGLRLLYPRQANFFINNTSIVIINS